MRLLLNYNHVVLLWSFCLSLFDNFGRIEVHAILASRYCVYKLIIVFFFFGCLGMPICEAFAQIEQQPNLYDVVHVKYFDEVCNV